MSVEDLLKPRYLVIANYPNSYYKVGSILKEKKDHEPSYEFIAKSMAQKYPEIFRKLEWWEMRDEKDMPQYIKWMCNEEIQIVKVDKYYHKFDMIIAVVENDEFVIGDANHDLPATEQEYLNYINSKQ